MSQGIVAIVGSPNVGKSTIFNRMIGDRRAIVDDEMGITRDRLYGQCEWLGRRFSLIDTGGIEIVNRPFQEQIRMQAEIAINEADVIVFVVDGKLGITTDDRVVTGILRKVNKPIILAVNKIDEGSHMADAQEFYDGERGHQPFQDAPQASQRATARRCRKRTPKLGRTALAFADCVEKGGFA